MTEQKQQLEQRCQETHERGVLERFNIHRPYLCGPGFGEGNRGFFEDPSMNSRDYGIAHIRYDDWTQLTDEERRSAFLELAERHLEEGKRIESEADGYFQKWGGYKPKEPETYISEREAFVAGAATALIGLTGVILQGATSEEIRPKPELQAIEDSQRDLVATYSYALCRYLDVLGCYHAIDPKFRPPVVREVIKNEIEPLIDRIKIPKEVASVCEPHVLSPRKILKIISERSKNILAEMDGTGERIDIKRKSVTLERVLDERSRIETIVRKFLPNRLVIEPYVDEEGEIDTLTLSELDENQKAIAYPTLANHFLSLAREGRENANRCDGVSKSYQYTCSFGLYIDALRCMKAISPNLRPAYLPDILREAKELSGIELSEKDVKEAFGGYYHRKIHHPEEVVRGIESLISELESTTPSQTNSPELRSVNDFEDLDEPQRRNLLLADSIAVSEDWYPENFDSCRLSSDIINGSRTAMAFMYEQAGEINLANALDKFKHGNSAHWREHYTSKDKVQEVTHNGDSFKILLKPKEKEFKIGQNKAIELLKPEE